MNVFLSVICTFLMVLDFFVLSKQKKKIEELTKENDKLKRIIEENFKKVSV